MGRPRTIDRDKVKEWSARGLPPDAVAALVGASVRQVKRILEEAARQRAQPTSRAAKERDSILLGIRCAIEGDLSLIETAPAPDKATWAYKTMAQAMKHQAEADAKRTPDNVPEEVVGAVVRHIVSVIDDEGRRKWGERWETFFAERAKPELVMVFKDEWPELGNVFDDA